jgi:hypothetical protein
MNSSILPEELEKKRLKIAKTHNRLVICTLIIVGLAFFLFLHLTSLIDNVGARHAGICVSFLCIAVFEFFSIYKILQYDKKMCEELDYMCPNCNRPIYEPRAATYLTGLCPKCNKSILPNDKF